MSTPISEPDWDPAIAGGERPSYYLAPTESAGQAHACWAWRHLTAPDGRRFAVVTIAPSLGPPEYWVLAPRHAGVTIDPPSEFPLFVYLLRPRGELPAGDGAPVDPGTLDNVAWMVLEPTWEDAQRWVEIADRANEATRGGPVAGR